MSFDMESHSASIDDWYLNLGFLWWVNEHI